MRARTTVLRTALLEAKARLVDHQRGGVIVLEGDAGSGKVSI